MQTFYSIKKVFAPLMLVTFFLLPTATLFAQSAIPAWFPCNGGTVDNPSIANGHPCTFPDLVTGTQEVAKEIVKLGLLVSPLIFAYAGYLYLTSGLEGNAKNRGKATGIFKNVVIGLIIMMLAWVIVNLILSALVCGIGSGGNWFNATPGQC